MPPRPAARTPTDFSYIGGHGAEAEGAAQPREGSGLSPTDRPVGVILHVPDGSELSAQLRGARGPPGCSEGSRPLTPREPPLRRGSMAGLDLGGGSSLCGSSGGLGIGAPASPAGSPFPLDRVRPVGLVSEQSQQVDR